MRIEEFERLREMRGWFQEGCRHLALLLFAKFLRGVGDLDIEAKLGELADECVPPLNHLAVKGAISGSKNMDRVTDDTIAEWLGITAQEATGLDKWTRISHLEESS